MIKRSRHIIFLGNPLPEDMVGDHAGYDVNIADNIAQMSVIKGLYDNNQNKLTIITVGLAHGGIEELSLGSGIKAIPVKGAHHKNRICYYLSITKNYTITLNKVLKKLKDREVVLITNGPYIYRAIPALFSKFVYRTRWIPFLVGAPEVPEEEFPLSIMSKLSKWSLRKADGAITYVKKTVDDYMPGKPFVEIVYAINKKALEEYKKQKEVLGGEENSRFTIAYTGALTKIYNLDLVIKVIKQTKDKYSWVIAGDGEYAEEIKRLSKSRIYDVTYLGRVSNAEAIKVQKESDLLLSLKGGSDSRANEYYSKYAASGKVSEYLCSGTPILLSDIPVYSREVRSFSTTVDSLDASVVCDTVDEIEKRYAEKIKLAKRGQEYALQHFTPDYQNKKIYEFLENF